MSLWVVALIGILTFAIRAVFVLGPKFDAIDKAQPWLMALPIAVMPILAVSSFAGQAFSVPKLAGLLACAAVGFVTRKTALAMAVGIGVYWLLQWLTASG